MNPKNIELEIGMGEIKPVNEWQKIKVLPKGEIYLAKYDMNYNFSDQFLNDIVQNFNNINIPKPRMDKNHEYKENYAEFRNPSIEQDGLYLEIRLNKAGVELVKDKVYMNISPSFGSYKDSTGKEYDNVLYAVSLTNFPALGTTVPDLLAQMQLSANLNTGEKRSMKQIAIELGLIPEASENVIVSKLQTQKIELAAVKTENEKLKLELSTAQTAAANLNKELSAIKEKEIEKEAKEVIELAVKNGQIHPSKELQDMYINRYKKDKEAVIKELSFIPKKESGQTKTAGSAEQTIELSADEAKLMELAGLNPKEKEDVQIWKATPKVKQEAK